MPKDLTCPHCKKSILATDGVVRDRRLNLRCAFCDRPVFSADGAAEAEIRAKVPAPAHYTARKEPLPIRDTGVKIEGVEPCYV